MFDTEHPGVNAAIGLWLQQPGANPQSPCDEDCHSDHQPAFRAPSSDITVEGLVSRDASLCYAVAVSWTSLESDSRYQSDI